MALVCCFIVNHRELGPAKALAEWIVELGGVRSHETMLCLTKPAQRIGAEDTLRPILEKAFGSVLTFTPHDEVEIPWPNDKVDARSPNHMFKRVSQEMEYNVRKPWLWLEMDAVPTKGSWMNELEMEYDKAKMAFMGVKLEAGGRPYMSGIAVYPANITRCTAMLRNPGMNQLGGQVPFDVFAGLDTTRMMHPTDLIQYVKPNPGGLADWSVSREAIESRTVLYHRSKDLSLIAHLRGVSFITQSKPAEYIDENGILAQPVNKIESFGNNWTLDLHPLRKSFTGESPLGFSELTRYHVCALEGLASTPERRKEIVGWLQIAGLGEPQHNGTAVPDKAYKRVIAPEVMAKRKAGLQLARDAKAKKRLALQKFKKTLKA